ncbi:Cerebellar degeneration-related protein 2-like, partial [Armadillidium nasatum]
YLSKQTAALREVNDSRLRIYEQLEISIQELENNNQRLTSESNSDKKKIKSLSTTIEHLEAKCDELQKCIDDSKTSQRRQVIKDHSQGQREQENEKLEKRWLSSPAKSSDGSPVRRTVSYESSSKCCENLARECMELEMRLESLQTKLKSCQEEAKSEAKRREDLEIELECASQENSVLREQLAVLKERENNFRSFEDELASVDDTSSSRICKKCMGLADDTGSSITMQDFTDDLEDMDSSYDPVRGDCALVNLKNGGYALGSQESLASVGQVVSCMISNESSPRTNGSEAPNSLLSELDTQYRILIEKYEALLETREKHELRESILIKAPPSQTIVDSGVDEMSGPMSIVTTNLVPNEQQRNVSVLCQRCATCSCDLKLTTSRPKSNMEEHSEVETSSSGFSEGETRLCSKTTQTDIDILFYQKEFEDAITPTPLGNNGKTWNIHTPMNPCESRFQTAPVYRKIFHEIFEVLKKDVDKENEDVNEIENGDIFDSDNGSKEKASENANKNSLDMKDENEENKNPNVKNINKKRKEVKSESFVRETKQLKDSKVPRPDFLDLDSSSRCSSRSRRKKRHQKHRQTINSESNDTQENAEVVSSKNICNEDKIETPKPPEPPAPVNTPTFVNSLPNVTSAINEDEYDESQGPISNTVEKQRCVHKRRKQKRSNKSQSSQSKIVSQKNKTITNSRYQTTSWFTGGSVSAPQNLPSVQVAKLIKFERTYAEVLKSRRA